jgi:hypothetical protein
MGTRRMPAISPAEMQRRYEAGESLTDLCLRTKLGLPALKTILASRGVVFRTQAEAARLGRGRQPAWKRLLP